MSKRLVLWLLFLGNIGAFFLSWGNSALMIFFAAATIVSHIWLTEIETQP